MKWSQFLTSVKAPQSNLMMAAYQKEMQRIFKQRWLKLFPESGMETELSSSKTTQNRAQRDKNMASGTFCLNLYWSRHGVGLNPAEHLWRDLKMAEYWSFHHCARKNEQKFRETVYQACGIIPMKLLGCQSYKMSSKTRPKHIIYLSFLKCYKTLCELFCFIPLCAH